MYKAKTIFVFLFLILAGCSSKPESRLLSMNIKDDPQTLDPRIAREPGTLMLMRMLYEGLTRIGPEDKPEFALAKDVSVSKDLKTYTFSLKDAYWANGDPVVANDFVYAWKKVLDPSFPSDVAYQLYVIKNGSNLEKGEFGAKALDDKILVVELEEPTPFILELFALPCFFPVHSSESFVENGPFVLKHWRHNDEIVVERNPSYWDAQNVRLEGVQLVMIEGAAECDLFEKGKLHFAGSPLSTLPVDALEHLREKGWVISKPKAETYFLRINIEHPLLSHLKLRQALSLAIDRESLIDHVLQGKQVSAKGLLPPSMKLSEEEYVEDHAKEKANQLFEEALEELGLTRKTFPKITYLHIQSERAHLVAQALQEQWRKALGIHIQLEAVERKVFFDHLSHQDYELSFCSWGADFHDPISFLDVFKFKSKSTNNTNWEDPNYIQLLDDSFTAEDRNGILAKCEKILMEAQPIIPLYHGSMNYLQSELMQGVFLSSLGNLDFKWASLDNSK